MMQKTTIDLAKAAALRNAAKRKQERLLTTPKHKYPSDTVVDYYTIIHCLLEAKAAEEGVNFRGDGSHAELIDWAAIQLSIPFAMHRFCHSLRELRNRALYDGLEITAEYLRRNEKAIQDLIELLQ